MSQVKSIQAILGHLRRADQDFDLIQDEDKIAIGLSGGKDSLVLLKSLREYQKFGVKRFEIIAITVDCTGGIANYGHVTDFCKNLGVEYHIEPSQIFEIIFNVRKEKSPCSLCSKLRRGILNSAAQRIGCNKIALAHHGDDLIETLLLSMIYEGRLSTFQPKSYLDRTNLTLIRPLVYATENEMIMASKGMPVLDNPCPVNHKTKREHMKKLIASFESEIPGARQRMLDATVNADRYNLFPRKLNEE